MTYELWSKTSRSIVGAFQTEAAAFDAVRAAIKDHGRAYAEAFAIIREDSRGRSTLLAEGNVLVEQALAGGHDDARRHRTTTAAER